MQIAELLQTVNHDVINHLALTNRKPPSRSEDTATRLCEKSREEALPAHRSRLQITSAGF